MKEQRKAMLMILHRLGVTYQYKHLGTHDVYFCNYQGNTFSISINGQHMNMNKFLGYYSADQQSAIFRLGKNVIEKGYDVILIDDNGEQHIGVDMVYSSKKDQQQLFYSICYFLQIISCGRFLQIKTIAA